MKKAISKPTMKYPKKKKNLRIDKNSNEQVHKYRNAERGGSRE